MHTHTHTITAVADGDYVPVIDQIIQFNRGDIELTHSITTSSIQNCEYNPNVSFSSVISQERDSLGINVVVPQTQISIIDDSGQEVCGKYANYSCNLYI